jgi:hypothetical protein
LVKYIIRIVYIFLLILLLSLIVFFVSSCQKSGKNSKIIIKAPTPGLSVDVKEGDKLSVKGRSTQLIGGIIFTIKDSRGTVSSSFGPVKINNDGSFKTEVPISVSYGKYVLSIGFENSKPQAKINLNVLAPPRFFVDNKEVSGTKLNPTKIEIRDNDGDLSLISVGGKILFSKGQISDKNETKKVVGETQSSQPVRPSKGIFSGCNRRKANELAENDSGKTARGRNGYPINSESKSDKQTTTSTGTRKTSVGYLSGCRKKSEIPLSSSVTKYLTIMRNEPISGSFEVILALEDKPESTVKQTSIIQKVTLSVNQPQIELIAKDEKNNTSKLKLSFDIVETNTPPYFIVDGRTEPDDVKIPILPNMKIKIQDIDGNLILVGRTQIPPSYEYQIPSKNIRSEIIVAKDASGASSRITLVESKPYFVLDGNRLADRSRILLKSDLSALDIIAKDNYGDLIQVWNNGLPQGTNEYKITIRADKFPKGYKEITISLMDIQGLGASITIYRDTDPPIFYINGTKQKNGAQIPITKSGEINLKIEDDEIISQISFDGVETLLNKKTYLDTFIPKEGSTVIKAKDSSGNLPSSITLTRTPQKDTISPHFEYNGKIISKIILDNENDSKIVYAVDNIGLSRIDTINAGGKTNFPITIKKSSGSKVTAYDISNNKGDLEIEILPSVQIPVKIPVQIKIDESKNEGKTVKIPAQITIDQSKNEGKTVQEPVKTEDALIPKKPQSPTIVVITDVDKLLNNIDLAIKSKKYDEALQYIDQYEKKKSQQAIARLYKGNIYYATGKYDEAVKQLEEAYDLRETYKPNSLKLENNLYYWEMSLYYSWISNRRNAVLKEGLRVYELLKKSQLGKLSPNMQREAKDAYNVLNRN